MTEKIKSWMKRYPLLYSQLKRIYKKLFPGPDIRLLIQQQIASHVKDLDSVFFVQVGSNDGVGGDPLHALISQGTQWRGMFIEPVSYLFQRLTQNYSGSTRFIFEQKAISQTACQLEFFYVSQDARAALGEDFQYWFEQLGSFSKEHILKHADGKLEPFIVSEPIQAVPLSQLLIDNAIPIVNVLHIDTEGHDYQVLRSFDFERYRPQIVLFEHEHLSESDCLAAEDLLRKYGYSSQQYGSDTLAISSTALS